MKRKTFNYFALAAGILLFAVGTALLKLIDQPEGVFRVLPYIAIALGCGAFGYGVGELVSGRIQRTDPRLAKQVEIDRNDERNIAIAQRAKAKAYNGMIYIFAALMLVFALMSMELTAVLLLVCAYLFVVGLYVYYFNKYQKEM
ncbi:MAG: DUF6442 family protein [Bacillota bacterium]|nr:DUF6442 family protein [Bacillota bacterium]